MAKKVVTSVSSLWKFCKQTFIRLFRRQSPLGKSLLTTAVIMIFVIVSTKIFSSSFAPWIYGALLVFFGWKWAYFIRGFPAFTMVVFYITLFCYLMLYSLVHPNSPIAQYGEYQILFIGSAFLGTIRNFFREKNPKSPFLFVRFRQLFPKHVRAIADSIGILAGTAILLIGIFYWEEVPKFVYNVVERKFIYVYDRIEKNSRDIDSLIERKKNEAISPEDFDLFTETYMDLFNVQQTYLTEATHINSIQSNIPYLSPTYREYHESKQQWVQAKQQWLTTFHILKRLEKDVSDVYFGIETIKNHMVAAIQNGSTNSQSALRQVITECQDMRENVDALKKQHQISEELEDYIAIRTKQIMDTSELILSRYWETTPEKEAYAKIAEISARGDSLDGLAIYGRWREKYCDPLEMDIHEQYATSKSLDDAMLVQFMKSGILQDRISPFVEKLAILPTYERVIETPPLPLTNSELEWYYRFYEDPFVLHVRKALDMYLAIGKETTGISKAAVVKGSKEDMIFGLQSFGKEYYKSKFVVIETYEESETLKYITIVFQDKPDRYFFAGVQALGNGAYSLEEFSSLDPFDQDDVKTMHERYGELLFDTKHSL